MTNIARAPRRGHPTSVIARLGGLALVALATRWLWHRARHGHPASAPDLAADFVDTRPQVRDRGNAR